ncbi:alpha/beta fold hydrolase [Noviluteimonas gilva]|uniref:alpha/beta fold hydrolase n=1 Tax=Noviluteimonas gilva TaxID=2682097 RepID=UPI0018D258C8
MSLLPVSSTRDNLRHFRVALRGLVGGEHAADRAGIHLPQGYDPAKRTLVMLHGLCSSPLIWARLTDAIGADTALRERFQVWHVLYQTNAPTIVARRRVHDYLANAYDLLDPRGDAPARDGIILIGHSFGGVIARLLCAESGTRLWDAAFTVPPDRIQARAEDVRSVEDVFGFAPFPGVSRAIFIAAPHRGSPRAMSTLGQVTRLLAGRRTPEIDTLQRVAMSDPDAVHPALREHYRHGAVNSVTSLQVAQPVRVASEALMPRTGIAYHTIAAAIPGRSPETDGSVPLDSALIDGARSTFVVPGDHHLFNDPATINEVLRILHESLEAVH